MGGSSFLDLWCRHSLQGQLTSNIKLWQGDFTADELAELKPITEYNDRAAACVKALGGPDQFEKLFKQWKSERGKNLLVAPGEDQASRQER